MSFPSIEQLSFSDQVYLLSQHEANEGYINRYTPYVGEMMWNMKESWNKLTSRQRFALSSLVCMKDMLDGKDFRKEEWGRMFRLCMEFDGEIKKDILYEGSPIGEWLERNPKVKELIEKGPEQTLRSLRLDEECKRHPCEVCETNKIKTTFIPCRHSFGQALEVCYGCFKKVSECKYCKEEKESGCRKRSFSVGEEVEERAVQA